MRFDVPMQWETEHDSPHCFACSNEIEIGDEVFLYRTVERIVWWHRWCAPEKLMTEDEDDGA